MNVIKLSGFFKVNACTLRRYSVTTLLRSLVSLLLSVWVGAVAFCPVIAAIAFKVLPDPHTAGFVVRGCLLALHREGLVLGMLLLVLLLAAAAAHAYRRTLLGPVLCTVAMLLLTAFSQWGILPRMERDRTAAGGDIDAVSSNNPYRRDFNRLHLASEELEEGVLAAGVAMVIFLARPER